MSTLSSKSIAELEAKEWPLPGRETPPLLIRCYELRKKPLATLTVADWRVLIGQDIGLEFLMPLALDVVERTPLVKTEHFPGDLLVVALGARASYFRQRPELRIRLERIVAALPAELEKLDFINFDTASEALEEATTEFRKGAETDV